MTIIINLTPHTINATRRDGSVRAIAPSGSVARCSQSSVEVGEVEGIPLYRTTFGEVTGLPAPEEGVLYIVSALVRMAVPHRADVVSPGELLRGPDGQPVGCKGLAVS